MNKAALAHAEACRELIANDDLAGALAYCARQHIEPPRYATGSSSGSADPSVDLVAQLLADYGWWVKRLKLEAARRGDSQIRAGSQMPSDENTPAAKGS